MKRFLITLFKFLGLLIGIPLGLVLTPVLLPFVIIVVFLIDLWHFASGKPVDNWVD